ncbi:MAG: hypothetical protein JJU21_07470 [Salinarimonas sp.]|nr:hypothetical protein [Salinarimonas sp.]
MTAKGEWKRLYPIRFRQLSDGSTFKRWDWVSFEYERPPQDKRSESCRVYEDRIRVAGHMKRPERARFLNPLVVPSIDEAAARGMSLALIRPRGTTFHYKRKSAERIAKEREHFAAVERQTSFLDPELKALEPTPYDFRFRFEDGGRRRHFMCGDWEVHTTFRKRRDESGSEEAALRWMDEKFNDEYPRKGMAFAVGNMAARPQTWMLLGIIRLDEAVQGELGF